VAADVPNAMRGRNQARCASLPTASAAIRHKAFVPLNGAAVLGFLAVCSSLKLLISFRRPRR
jgi:hypothetical protein